MEERVRSRGEGSVYPGSRSVTRLPTGSGGFPRTPSGHRFPTPKGDPVTPALAEDPSPSSGLRDPQPLPRPPRPSRPALRVSPSLPYSGPTDPNRAPGVGTLGEARRRSPYYRTFALCTLSLDLSVGANPSNLTSLRLFRRWPLLPFVSTWRRSSVLSRCSNKRAHKFYVGVNISHTLMRDQRISHGLNIIYRSRNIYRNNTTKNN